MSCAIIRNAKYKMNNTIGACRHNERKNENYSNKDIDLSKSHLNYHLKEPLTTSYEKEFFRLYEENNLQGNLRLTGKKQSTVACEFLITSDHEFFKDKTPGQTKQFFEDSYEFIKNKCSEENIISAVVHMDETTPHMHLVYIPVVTKKNKKEEWTKRVNCSEFWKGYNSYGELQDQFYEHCKNKGYDLERGEVGSKAEHLDVIDYKLQSKQQEMKELEKGVLSLEGKNEQLKSEKDTLQTKISDLSKALEGKVLDIQEILAINPKKGLGGIIKDISLEQIENLKKTAFEGMDNKSKLRNLKNELERAESSLDYLENKEQRLKSEIFNLKTELAKVKSENTKYEVLKRMIKSDPELQKLEEVVKKTVSQNIDLSKPKPKTR